MASTAGMVEWQSEEARWGCTDRHKPSKASGMCRDTHAANPQAHTRASYHSRPAVPHLQRRPPPSSASFRLQRSPFSMAVGRVNTDHHAVSLKVRHRNPTNHGR